MTKSKRTACASFAGALLTLSACGGPPVTREECDLLLEHYVEQLLCRDGAAPSPVLVTKLQLAAQHQAATHRDFLACPRRVTRTQMTCALEATSADAIERCLIPMW